MTKDIVNSALSKVLYPGFTKDIVTFGFVNSQTIQSDNHNTTGFIKSDGTIQNSNHNTVGFIKNDGNFILVIFHGHQAIYLALLETITSAIV